MSAIFDNANSITLGHKLSLVQTSSHSGKRSAQRRGPYLYTFEVAPNDMTTSSDSYHNINSELRTISYGVNTSLISLPSSYTSSRGSWVGTPLVKSASQTGSSITLDGFTISKSYVIKDGDFIQFNGDTKVYQVVGDYDSDVNGNAVAHGTTTQGVSLNTPLVRSPADNAAVTDGSSVLFKVALTEYSDASISPRNATDNLASWSSFKFEEVI